MCVYSITPLVLPPQLFDELAFSPLVLGAQSRDLTQLVWVTLSVKGADLVHTPAMVTIRPGTGTVGGGQSMDWCWGCWETARGHGTAAVEKVVLGDG